MTVLKAVRDARGVRRVEAASSYSCPSADRGATPTDTAHPCSPRTGFIPDPYRRGLPAPSWLGE